MSDARFSSFAEFFPYYLGEHRDPRCRALHFVGTAGFFSMIGWAAWLEPARFGPALAGILALGVIGNVVERRRNAAPVMFAMIALGVWAQPWLLAGVVWAYAFAWIAHFKIEHNKPATFIYPLWSLLGDFKMWSMMVSGKLWTGDPIQELELSVSAPDA
ncbi:hypothetical protein ENSA5_01240 [Enhygromyxa salina]|uniref:DUF962 domain-containing protein n=1 Tax=Enhygromyxa salina TaxID=215803 RepID=A0A2S9YL67_9BACT|nr:DUF962 domain-containing protein [Enhygromyxa salina]PRQ05804.1 hypothetical protein ENSA5_01240 [Enhygromyxa salina]